MVHQFAVDEVLTKVSILRREFLQMHRYNPIEHVGARVKSPTNILDKALRRGVELTPEAISVEITDIAGVDRVDSIDGIDEQMLRRLWEHRRGDQD